MQFMYCDVKSYAVDSMNLRKDLRLLFSNYPPLFPELLNDRGLNSIVNELLAYNLIYNFIAMS